MTNTNRPAPMTFKPACAYCDAHATTGKRDAHMDVVAAYCDAHAPDGCQEDTLARYVPTREELIDHVFFALRSPFGHAAIVTPEGMLYAARLTGDDGETYARVTLDFRPADLPPRVIADQVADDNDAATILAALALDYMRQ